MSTIICTIFGRTICNFIWPKTKNKATSWKPSNDTMQHIYVFNCHEDTCEYEFPYDNYKENAKLSAIISQNHLLINLHYDTQVRCEGFWSVNQYYPDVTPEKLTLSLYDKIMYSILTTQSAIIFPNEHNKMIEIAKSGLYDGFMLGGGCTLRYEPMEMITGSTSNTDSESL